MYRQVIFVGCGPVRAELARRGYIYIDITTGNCWFYSIYKDGWTAPEIYTAIRHEGDMNAIRRIMGIAEVKSC